MSPFTVERRAVNQLPPEPHTGDAFGLRSAVDTVLQHGWLALGVFATVMLLAGVYTLLAEPVYRADTLVRFDPVGRDSLLPGSLNAAQSSAELLRAQKAAETEVMISREVVLPVVAALGVDISVGSARRDGWLPVGARHGVTVPQFRVPAARQDKPFMLSVEGGRFELQDRKKVLVASGTVGTPLRFQLDGAEALIEVRAPADSPSIRLSVAQQSPLNAFEDVRKRLRMAELSRESGVVRLTFEDTDAVRSAAFLNGIVERYLSYTVSRKADQGQRMLEFVEAQLAPMKARVEAAEQALASYQQSQRAAPLNVEADALLRQRGDLERQWVDLQIKRDQLAQSVTAEHPELAAVLRQLGTVRAALDRLSTHSVKLPDQSREIVRLQREAQSEAALYTSMQAQAQQLRLASGGWMATAVQLDRAVTPIEKLRPRAGSVLSVGAGFGLLLALAATLLAHALQPTVTTAQSVISRAAPPTLAVIPESQAQKRLMAGRMDEESLEELGTHRLLARASPEDPAVEALRSVHLSLMLRESSISTKVILVTSPSAGTGKSFVAANLAAVMAETGRRVLLVEADLRKPGLHKIVGIDEFAVGLSDLLSQSRSLERVIHRHPSAGFDVLLQGTRNKKKSSLLLSPVFESAIAELRGSYDHIVINGAPAMPSRDALVVGRLADIALLVVRAEQSLLQETRMAVRRLEHSGVKLEGLLFNGVKRNRLNAHVLT